eukprot:CAMPEP_0117849718 /NCGR_PEP_ID=MMETSP0949-20121206/21266_1 /TAXON_ID=44440 /ORGANISM="Chattonella subsalsa, Strain CCMP2191" /LENGTH=624 /DNA_ID=CAMNT_0005696989 /DNA_START=53 /DNA_END=1928 /DNA_ORIENTATION=+
MSLQDFDVIGTAGEGSFASVLKVKRKADNEIYAMKKVNVSKMNRKEIRDTLNEIRFLASVRHPYIVGFYECFQVKEENLVCIILEYCANGDLAGEVSKQEIKLGDMNVSKRIKDGMLLQTQTGTPYYMSPEIWANRSYDSSSDMWALGVLFYEICALKKPFTAQSFPELRRKVTAGRYPPLKQRYSQDLVHVISMLLRVNPEERPQAWDKVPHSMDNLDDKLPQACYPDKRPNSPEKWPAIERARSLSPRPLRRRNSGVMKKTKSECRRRRFVSDNSMFSTPQTNRAQQFEPLRNPRCPKRPSLIQGEDSKLTVVASPRGNRSLSRSADLTIIEESELLKSKPMRKHRAISDSHHFHLKPKAPDHSNSPQYKDKGLRVKIDSSLYHSSRIRRKQWKSQDSAEYDETPRDTTRSNRSNRGHSEDFVFQECGQSPVSASSLSPASHGWRFRGSSLESFDGAPSQQYSSPRSNSSYEMSEAEVAPIVVKGSVAQTMEEAKKSVSNMTIHDPGFLPARHKPIIRQHSDEVMLKGGLDNDKKLLRRAHSHHERQPSGAFQPLQPAIPVYVSNSVLEKGPINGQETPSIQEPFKTKQESGKGDATKVHPHRHLAYSSGQRKNPYCPTTNP